MSNDCPDFTCNKSNGRLVCTGDVRPTPLSRTYAVRIECTTEAPPLVYVEKPELISRSDEEEIPHTYGKNRPCLYYPPRRDWTPEKPISKTIVPWLSLWLFYYEIWLVTGQWEGGGMHNGKEEVVSELTNSEKV